MMREWVYEERKSTKKEEKEEREDGKLREREEREDGDKRKREKEKGEIDKKMRYSHKERRTTKTK